MTPKITNNTTTHRFEAELGAETAFLEYSLEANVITFTHTRVPASIGGRGIGTALVIAGLDYAVKNGLRVVPQCPFVAAFLEKHPRYQETLGATPGEKKE
jgi:predicted GNAT family acetyltransferase